ncbi:MAG: hypothetical protein A2287_09820 [Candidatus Melainabacteria bacterium RIFOXYA12_FULL_32_12]|nr:MAG: hypothetical protein A2255_00060 [Candidatus Melainabacteria bacterium RIFOXYA2_FULL_32_9]OGI28122.1 MAG: hypothetical protein A2287_09820 [Candidatus Melainabacteria bacterium RIFOXYA12_FULL_32_12]
MIKPIQLEPRITEEKLLSSNQKQSSPFFKGLNADTAKFDLHNNNIAFRQNGKVINVVSFTGLKNPLEQQKPAIQMRVAGVKNHQNSMTDPTFAPKDKNVQELAESDWKDGQELTFKIAKAKNGQRIALIDPNIGEIGYVHKEIADIIMPALKRNPKDFKFELSNVIAGMGKGAETIGLRVNLLYTGNDEKKAQVGEVFNKVLNNPECSESAMLYQPEASPEEVLSVILDKDPKAKEIINNIVREIKDPSNKRILVLGHCKPDGDTLGSALALKNAIKLMDSERKVDGAVDDKIPGLFRHKLPGIDGEIKRPYNPEFKQKLEKEITSLKNGEQNDQTKGQIEILEDELEELKNPEDFLNPKDKYDLVILLDVPTPERFTNQFKNYIEGAKKVIYVDHHPHRPAEWDRKASQTGLDMNKVHNNKLAWIADTVPAATQMVSIIANKLLPQMNDIEQGKISPQEAFNKPGQLDKFKAFVASIVTGISTDTGSFLRTANLLPEHMKMPVQKRPNFMPEGESKYLMNMTDGVINKKWLREEINYDISDGKVDKLKGSARDLMLEYSLKGLKVYPDSKLNTPDLGLGIVEVDYDKMYDVWHYAREAEKQEGKKPEINFLDVQNSFKINEITGTLRANPLKHKPEDHGVKKAAQYESDYDADRIAILICQDKKAGRLDEKLNIASNNGLRLSLRSQEGTIWAELLANLFGGGGHGDASGGRVDLPGINLDSKLAVKINGEIERDPATVLKKLKNNHEIMNNVKLTNAEKQAKVSKIELTMDSNGRTCSELIADLVKEIRSTQPKENNDKSSNKHKKNLSFSGNKVISIKEFIPKIFAKNR